MSRLRAWYTGDTIWLCVLILVMVTLIGAAVYFDEHSGSANARFERVHEEELPHGHHVEVYRDKEHNNQEVVCIYGAHYVPSCYPTGRTVK